LLILNYPCLGKESLSEKVKARLARNRQDQLSSKVEQTYQEALGVLRRNAVKRGLRTSHAYYNQIWSRDAFISFLGANTVKDEALLQCARTTVETFARTRAPLGQIASFHDLSTDLPEFGFSGSTDSSCWYIIGLASLFHATEDKTLLGPALDAAADAYRFVRFQDANNSWLVDSPQGADWMDAAIQRTGKTLYNNVLFLAATKCLTSLLASAGRPAQSIGLLEYDELKERFTDVFLPGEESIERISKYWPRLATHHKEQKLVDLSRKFYLQYISFARIDSHFDTLSNLLCAVWGVADDEAARSILDTISARGLTRPFPIRCLDPPYKKGEVSYDEDFDAMLPIQHRSGPLDYHNGGVWPFVGGFYVCALRLCGVEDGTQALASLANANRVFREGETVGFNEWLDGRKGEARGQYGQSWSAGMYIAAHAAAQGIDPFAFLR
jgi:glycogen debranching enzyme